MPVAILGPVKGNRLPSTAIPGSKGKSRPVAQKGGGGNKEAGSKEVTAATAPTVTVHSDGSVTAEHFSPSKAGEAAATAAVARQKAAQAHVRKVVALVNSKARTKAPVAKGIEAPKTVRAVPVAAITPAKPSKLQVDRAIGKAIDKASLDVMETGYTVKAKKIGERVEKRLGAEGGVLTAADYGKPTKPKLNGTPQERKAARSNLRKAKQEVRKAGGSAASITTPVIQAPEQRKILAKVLNTGKRMGASKKEELAAIDTGIQETGFKNLKPYENSYGEDTAGWREELAPYYTDRRNVGKAAKAFFEETKTDPSIPGGGGETPGELAQTVQGSAYGGEETYGTHTPEAQAIYKAFFGSSTGNRGQAIKNLKAAKQEAKELGLKVGGRGVGKPSPELLKRTTIAERAMRSIEGSPYIWGGGHGSFKSKGYDCSGAVSYVLHSIGALKTPLTSGDMGSVLKPGPGALTVFYNAGHTFLRYINKKGEPVYWGTSVGDDGVGGLTQHAAPSQSYLDEFNVGHVPGMGKKQALQLGAIPGSLTGGSPESFPGMTFSEGGTTATISSGSGTVNAGKPGFSKTPIRSISAPQRIRNAEATLKAGDLKAGKEAEPASTSILDSLAKKYGAAA